MGPLDDWLRLLLKFKDVSHYRRRYLNNVYMVAGDTLRITWTFDINGNEFEALIVVPASRTMVVAASVLYIEAGVAYIAVEQENDLELIYRKMPDVWQLHGAEDDDTLSIPERRAQEIYYVLH